MLLCTNVTTHHTSAVGIESVVLPASSLSGNRRSWLVHEGEGLLTVEGVGVDRVKTTLTYFLSLLPHNQSVGDLLPHVVSQGEIGHWSCVLGLGDSHWEPGPVVSVGE